MNAKLRRTPVVATALVALTLLVGALAGGCIVGTGTESDDTATVDSDLTAGNSITRAEEWVSAKLQYCQSANHARDYDAACSTYCQRTDNAAWDPYRSDCSGLVSWAWGLPAPGRVTGELAPFVDDITYSIPASNLQAGDAVNNSDHVMLFKAWVTHDQAATFIEEPGCSANPPHAHEFTSAVSVSGDSIYVHYNGMTFTAIRYRGFSSGGGGDSPPGCSVNGDAGTCIDTGACAAKGGHHSTPGYCPGPASEECCTKDASAPPPPPPPPSSGPSCTVEGIQGVCIAKSVCVGMSGHVSTPGFCPGPASEECCTKPKTCHVNGVEGMCIETSVCASMAGHHSTPGYCPGPANEECCTK